MKSVLKFGSGILFVAAIGLSSCEGPKLPEMSQVYDYQDSILHTIPGIGTVQARVERDFNTEAIVLKLYIRDVGFYSSSPEKMQEEAVKAGQMALKVFGDVLDKGVFIATKELQSQDAEPADGIKMDMKLDSLKKASKK